MPWPPAARAAPHRGQWRHGARPRDTHEPATARARASPEVSSARSVATGRASEATAHIASKWEARPALLVHSLRQVPNGGRIGRARVSQLAATPEQAIAQFRDLAAAGVQYFVVAP